VTSYREVVGNLGIEDADASFGYTAESDTPGLAMLADKFMERLEEQMASWFRMIVKDDLAREPLVKDDGRLWTPGAIDFFRSVHDQVATVQECTSGHLLHRAGQLVVKQLNDYLAEQRAAMEDPQRTLEQMAACINNNVLCYEQCMELVESLEEELDDEYKGTIDVEAAARGFLEVAAAFPPRLPARPRLRRRTCLLLLPPLLSPSALEAARPRFLPINLPPALLLSPILPSWRCLP